MGILSYNAWTYFGSGGLALLLTPIAIRLANSYGIVDVPNVRKVHHSPVPRVGGVAIALSALVCFAIALILFHGNLSISSEDLDRTITLLVAAASIAIVGFIDDVWEVPPKYKLLALAVGAGVFCGSGGLIRSITINGHLLFAFGSSAWPITLLWMIGVTVSINFIDGLDGLAAGIVALGCAVLAIGCAVSGYPLGALLSLALCGSLSGFLFFNRNPAKIFMGDSGSMFIGFLLAGTAVLASNSIGTTRSLILPVITLSVPLFDTFFTMVRRSVLQRSSIFAPERGHIHHRLLDVGLCHQHVVLLLHGVTLAGALVALVCIFAGGWASTIAAVVFIFALLILFKSAGSVRARETLTAIRHNRALGRDTKRYQSVFHELQLGFREVHTFELWWNQVCKSAQCLDFAKIDLPVTRRDGSESVLRWRRDGELLAATASITAEVPIPQRRTAETLRARIEVLVPNFLESGGHRVAIFSRLMGEFGLDKLKHRAKSKDAVKQAQVDAPPQPTAHADAEDAGPFAHLRVAIVHDFLYTYAGAERVLEQLVEIFPHASLFSLFDFLPDNLRGFIRNKPVVSTFLQRMPFARSRHRAYLPLMPLAIEQLNVSEYDLIISSSYVAAKGIITRPDQLHICYCHTPVRFAWELQGQYLNQAGFSGLKSIPAKLILHYIRGWDVRSANGVDVFFTNSDYVGRRIRKTYRRHSTTIHPPVDTDLFSLHEQKEDYYLTASRMVPYKRMDLVIEAFTNMPDRRLFVVGDGPDMQKLRGKAGPNITFLGHEPVERLRRHMQMARAFVFAAEEDFGIAPVEAQACGTPVIAFGRGGARESIVDGQTGLFFSDQTVEAVIDAVERFESREWDYAGIRKNAERFSIPRFRDRFVDRIRKEWTAFKSGQLARDLSIGISSEHLDRQIRSALQNMDVPVKQSGELEAAGESM